MMRKRERFEVRRCRAAAHFERSRTAWLAIGSLLCAMPSFAAQDWRGKRVYFGDAHWHSCLSQDASATLTGQYQSMLWDYGLDFSLQSDHAEGAEAGITLEDFGLIARVPKGVQE